MIRLENVSKHYARAGEIVKALDGVSFEIPKGTFALLKGPSGSGKTTLINLTAGLARPTEGTITIAENRLGSMSPARRAALRARQIAVVFQMFHLVPYLTALENVLLPTLAATPENGGSATSRAEQLLNELGLGHRLAHRPNELSVGERQRCALARALLNQPDVILADEPTGNLDPASAEKVLATLAAAHRDGATILLASHHPIEGIEPGMELNLLDGVLQPSVAAEKRP
jgi:putative ABC transport system ATP-binding protein